MEAQKDVKNEHAPKSMKKGHSKRDWFFIQTNARCHYKLANVSLMCNNNSFDEDVRYFFQTHWHRDWLDKKPSKNILFLRVFSWLNRWQSHNAN